MRKRQQFANNSDSYFSDVQFMKHDEAKRIAAGSFIAPLGGENSSDGKLVGERCLGTRFDCLFCHCCSQ